jgi:uncharacterized protein
MMEEQKNLQMRATRQEVGWVYQDLPWPSDSEAQEANRQRQELLNGLSDWITYSFSGTKPHSGPLSPGCKLCGSGSWGCNFISSRCTRRCFFCPQDLSPDDECKSETFGMVFHSPEEHVAFLKTFNLQGVGFSGGEPFLAFDRLLAHVAAIRKEIGNSIYLWLYTNGDLVNPDNLKQLQEAGLDEMRFDLTARHYDLSPIKLAKNIIPAITVEIPVIPEDYEILKRILVELEHIGVDFLNIHQLDTSEHNYKALVQRRYHFTHQPNLPVLESEICALKLLTFAKEQNCRLPINYCGSVYKNRFQPRGKRHHVGQAVRQGFEEISGLGYLRFFVVEDSPGNLRTFLQRLMQADIPSEKWQLRGRGTRIALHESLLPYVDCKTSELSLIYCEPGVRLLHPDKGYHKENLVPDNTIVFQEQGLSASTVEAWRLLYLEGTSPQEVFATFFQEYPLEGPNDFARLQQEMGWLKHLARFEELESGLPEIF